MSKSPDDDPTEAKITVAALALGEHVADNLETGARSLVADWLKQHAKEISYKPESVRARYTRLQSEAKEPQPVPRIETQGTIVDAVSISSTQGQSDDELLEAIRTDSTNRWPQHLYQDPADGRYWKKPSTSDGLERAVLATELHDPSLVAWYRNPAGGDRALCIPYRDSGDGGWARLHPDFIVFHDVDGEIQASIIDRTASTSMTGQTNSADTSTTPTSTPRGIAPSPPRSPRSTARR